MSAIELVWAGLLVVVVVSLPFAVVALHRLWRASRNIEHYFGEMATACRGIERSTSDLESLHRTIEVAGELLRSSSSIGQNSGKIRHLLEQRAARR